MSVTKKAVFRRPVLFGSYQNDGKYKNIDKTNTTIPSNFKKNALKYVILGVIAGLSLILIYELFSNSSSQQSQQSIATNVFKSTSDDSSDPYGFCESPLYFRKVLKNDWTQSCRGLLKGKYNNVTKFEASGIIYDELRDVYWVVFDSLYAIGKYSSDLSRNNENILVKSDVDNIDGESGYEGITHDKTTDTFYLLTESVLFDNNNGDRVYHPIITSVYYNEDSDKYHVIDKCAVSFQAASDNKGFESLNLVQINGQKWFVAMCEGNHCESGSKGRDKGNGRMVLIEAIATNISNNNHNKTYDYLRNEGFDCVYNAVNEIFVPASAYFEDYSAMAFRNSLNNTYDLAIVSQASSAIWIGTAELSLDTFVFDDVYQMLEFPKNDNCETVFCNVEGIAWNDDASFVAVSDQAKEFGGQPFVCKTYDQSIHIFSRPGVPSIH